MKKTAILTFCILLFGCEKGEKSSENLPTVQSEKVQLAGENERCGEHLKIKCANGMRCARDGETPEKAGVCQNTVIRPDLECSSEQKPVCGRIGDRKNGFLNACEAARNGAEILNSGFCGRENRVENNCEIREILAIGGCENLQKGAFFDGKKCREKSVFACDIQAPFPDLRACESACKN